MKKRCEDDIVGGPMGGGSTALVLRRIKYNGRPWCWPIHRNWATFQQEPSKFIWPHKNLIINTGSFNWQIKLSVLGQNQVKRVNK